MFKALGAYQLALLASRIAGLSRDVSVVLLYAVSLLSDDLLFLFSFSDVVMTLLISGGAALYFSERAAKISSSEEYSSFFFSSIILYVMVSLFIICVEVFFDGLIATAIYHSFEPARFKESYLIALSALVISLPLTVFNGVFLYQNKLFYQPLVNFVFTLVVLIGLFFGSAVEENQLLYYSGVVFSAAIVRLLVSIFLYLKVGSHLPNLKFEYRNLFSFFDVNLLYAGVGIGFFIFSSFAFRGGISSYSEGFYSLSVLAFKFNDLLMAFIIIPFFTILLRGVKTVHNKAVIINILKAEILLFIVILLVLYALRWLYSFGLISLDFREIFKYVSISLLFSVPGYIISMYLIKLGRTGSVVFTSSALVFSILFMRDSRYDFHAYFSVYYILLTAHFLVSSALYSYFANKKVREC